MDDNDALQMIQAYNAWQEDLREKEPDDTPAAFLEWRTCTTAAWRLEARERDADAAVVKLEAVLADGNLDPQLATEIRAAKMLLESSAVSLWA